MNVSLKYSILIPKLIGIIEIGELAEFGHDVNIPWI